MDSTALFVSFLVMFIQLSDSYLRYLPFAKQLNRAATRRLALRLIAWALATVPICHAIFVGLGVGAVSYKAVLMLGWIPYVLIQMTVVRNQPLQHLFVVGMSAIWVLLQNNWAAIIDAIFFLDRPVESLLAIHSLLYLILFGAMLPIERHFFKDLIPNRFLFENRPQGFYIALMPTVISLGHVLLWADDRLVHSWAERISRLGLIVAFLFIWEYVLVGARIFFDHKKTLRNHKLIEAQLASLEHQNRTMQANQLQLIELRDNIRDEYQSMIELLSEGRLAEAKDYIRTRTDMLDQTKSINFCLEPIINAALSIYIQYAESLGIKIEHRINLPPNLATDENELAIVLSNLIENAINASQKQAEDRREISIIIQHRARQFVLEIGNRFDGTLELDENNLPYTSREGHGLGMASLAAFIKKYGAYASFSQADGRVKVLMYWEDAAI